MLKDIGHPDIHFKVKMCGKESQATKLLYT